jgi:HK97 family phage major capsid protein
MKKINELNAERAELIAKMEAITNSESLTDELRSEYSGYDTNVKQIDNDITLAKRQEELNKQKVATMETGTVESEVNKEKKHIGVAFREWLVDAVENDKKTTFRADPIISSTDSAIIEKTVAAGIDILKSPAEAYVRSLGVQFYTGLKNQLVLPRMAEDTAAFPGENTGAASAGLSTSSLTLAPRRVSHTQSISKETLSEVNPALYTSILQNLLDGVWNCVTNDLFDTAQTDTVGQRQTAGITYATIAGLEASLGYTNIGSLNFVTTPGNKATLKTTARMTAQSPIWGDDNTVLGYPASACPGANATMMYLGDFSKLVVAQWGGIEIVVDPYKDAAKGLINLTVIGMFDTGCYQPKAITWCSNA